MFIQLEVQTVYGTNPRHDTTPPSRNPGPSLREATIVALWLRSSFTFHTIRDNYFQDPRREPHLWCAKAGGLPTALGTAMRSALSHRNAAPWEIGEHLSSPGTHWQISDPCPAPRMPTVGAHHPVGGILESCVMGCCTLLSVGGQHRSGQSR